MKRILLLSLLLLGGLLLGRYGLQARSAANSDDMALAVTGPLPVATLNVELSESYTYERFYSGTVRARRTSELSFERSGRVTALYVQEGQRVEVGEALATQDVRRLHAQQKELQSQRAQAVAELDELLAGPRQESIRRARSNLEDIEEQLRLERLQLTRVERLYREDVASKNDLDEAASQEKQLVARLHVAEEELEELVAGTRTERIRAQEAIVDRLDASLEIVDVEIEDSVLRAPFGGVIAARLSDEGKTAGAGEVILKLVEDTELEAWIGVSVSLAGSLEIGKAYALTIDGDSFRGTLIGVLPEVSSRTRTVSTIFALEGECSDLRPGQLARLGLEKSVDESGFWIPTASLTRGMRGLWNCFVLETGDAPDSNGAVAFVVARRQVQVLYSEGERSYVRGTLRAGDTLISEGTHRLAVGQQVTPAAERS